MPKKTLYVRDEDVQIWERAEAIDNESLSSVVTTALRRYVLSKEMGGPYERIELKVAVFTEDGRIDGSRTVAFQGRFLARQGGCLVYETAKKRIAFYSPMDEYFCLDDYDSLDEAAKAKKYSSTLLSEVAGALHGANWVEELDI